jgi:hypothetical protein
MTFLSRKWFWLGMAVLLTTIKIWLTRGQGIFAIGSAGHDDRLFVELAQHLIRGEWLGPYNELTLAKGPLYSLFIAAAFLVGIPLFLAQQTFYAAACALVARSLRPAIPSAGIRFGLFALLLWNPMSYDMPGMGRILRQQIYGSLALMIFAGLIALYLRRREPSRRLVPWALLSGLSAGAFYLTREETIWIIPSLLLLAAAFVVSSWRESKILRLNAMRMTALGLLAASLPVLAVSTLNKHYYGWFGTCEFRAEEFQDAYGAMLRVQAGPHMAYVPVTREAREAMARVSPKFAELQQQFTSGLALGWAQASEFFTHLPPSEGQIGGGWMMWAVREATARAGHCGNAAQAMVFYRDLAREINQACDQGLLTAGPRRSGFLPIWHQESAGTFVHNIRVFTDFVARFSHFSAQPNPSQGSPEELQLFRDMTRERLAPPEGEIDVVGVAQYLLNVWKTDMLQRIGKSLRPLLPVLFYLAQVWFLLRVIWLLWRRSWTYPLTLAAAAWGACAASVLIHAFIETTSFPVLTVTSFAPIYPLLLLFVFAAFWDLVTAWKQGAAPLALAALSLTTDTIKTQQIYARTGLSRWLPWAVGLSALLPLLIWYKEFRELFWFGDDFFLLDQLAQMGLLKWSTLVFSENFVPLFKVLWGTAVVWFGGSYLAMLWLLWLTHSLNTLIFARLMLRSGFPWAAALISALVFALSPANIETLGWSVQWSAVLATTFFLLGLWWLEINRERLDRFSWRIHLPLFLLAAASACSFSRGVLTGAVMATGLILPAVIGLNPRLLLKRLPGIMLCLVPAVSVALIIKLNSSGNHQHMMGHWGDILEFGMSYFLLNPLHALLGGTSLHPGVMLLMAVTKVVVILAALMLSRGRVWHLLILLLAFDLGNALLVGIGRYHTGFLASLSSRYQYGSIISTLPFVSIVLCMALARLPWPKFRQLLTVGVIGSLVLYCLWGWPKALVEFTGWRGTQMRQLLAAPSTVDPTVNVPTLDFMHIERAKALQRAYDLH